MIRRLRDLRHNVVGILGAVVVWCLLWGGFSASDILGGLAAVVLVYLIFPMPSPGREITVRPLAFLSLLGIFLFDLVKSSIEVGWYAVRPGPQPASSVIAVPMASRSDLFLTGTAILSTLIPGSVVVEAQRSTGTLFLHIIGAGTEAEVERARQRAVDQEARLLRALARREVLEGAGMS